MLTPTMQKKIKEAKTDKRLPFKHAYDIAREFCKKTPLRYRDALRFAGDQTFMPNAIMIVGSIRRQRETIGDIDLFVTGHLTLEDIKAIPGVEEIWSAADNQIFFNYVSDDGTWRPINIWQCEDPRAFGAFLIHVTGSRPYNIMMRSKAKYKGYKLNQYGLFNAETDRYLAGKTEESVFKKLNVEYKAPKNRGK